MKKLRSYLLSAVVMLLFTCTFMGIKTEAATSQVTGLKQNVADYNADNCIYLEWTALLDNGVKYEVSISTDKSNWEVKNMTSDNECQIDGLNAGSTYYVRVRAYIPEWDDESWEEIVTDPGAYSSVLECVTGLNTDPSYLKKTNSTTNTMTLQWGKAPGANAYVVKYYPNGTSAKNAKSTIVTKNTVTLTKLKKNKDYTVEVYGIRRTSNGNFATEACYDSWIYESGLGVTPSKVTGVEVETYWDTLGQLDVECKKIECADGYEAEVWTAYKKKDSRLDKAECEYTTSISGITTTYLGKATLKKPYFFKVRMRAYSLTSTGKKKYGEWSDWKYTCQQPTVTKVKNSKKGMSVTWDAIKGADRYVLYASTKQKSGYKKVATTSKTSYTMKKFNKKALTKGKNYYFYVVAYNKIGNKYYSGEAGNANSCWYKKYTY